MKALGVGWTVQDAMYFGGEAFVQQAGAGRGAAHAAGRDRRARSASPIGAGTDAHRVASYNPFTVAAVVPRRQDRRRRSRFAGRRKRRAASDALRFYTLGSAWFSLDEDERGSLEVGKLADLAVLSEDYLTVPVGARSAASSRC